ncbi:MAG: Bor family protein [Spirochaetia bacterium]|nr:Bor family protein [Spirochaetia bacterium]
MLLLLITALFLFSCRHASVAFQPLEPVSCSQGFLKKNVCEHEKEKLQERIKSKEGEKHTFVHNFYLFGFLPRSVDLDVTNLCKEHGIWEIHQYSTPLQGLYSELSLGFFVPRTTDVQCY